MPLAAPVTRTTRVHPSTPRHAAAAGTTRHRRRSRSAASRGRCRSDRATRVVTSCSLRSADGIGAHQMRGQRGLRRAEPPDVQIVHLQHAGHARPGSPARRLAPRRRAPRPSPGRSIRAAVPRWSRRSQRRSPRLASGSSHSQPVSRISSPATTTAAETPASAAMCTNCARMLMSCATAAQEQQRRGTVHHDAGGGDQDHRASPSPAAARAAAAPPPRRWRRRRSAGWWHSAAPPGWSCAPSHRCAGASAAGARARRRPSRAPDPAHRRNCAPHPPAAPSSWPSRPNTNSAATKAEIQRRADGEGAIVPWWP